MKLQSRSILASIGLALAVTGALAQPRAPAQASSSAEPGWLERTEKAIVKGATIAVSGVERGLKAAASGVEKGAKAAGSGVERGGKATERALDTAANKVVGPSAPASSTKK